MAREPTVKHGEITIQDRRRKPVYRIIVCGACADRLIEFIYEREDEDNGGELDRD